MKKYIVSVFSISITMYILLAKLLESSLEFVSHMAFFVEIVIKRPPTVGNRYQKIELSLAKNGDTAQNDRHV